MRKKRVLVLTEATYLNTGYASDGREILRGLQKSGKYDIAEFSIYGSSSDPRRHTIPWKNYPNLPCDTDSDEVRNMYSSNPSNQFGAWRFERVALDFKPDVVHDIRDPWMCSFVRQSPYRNLFSWIWKATVDAAPQNAEWISAFASTDSFMTLTDWGKETVSSQSDQKNIGGVGSICAPRSFKPVPKRAHKISMGLDPDCKIIGTVMRNQRRKLFPDLFEAFGKYLKETGDTNTYLYCHTSYPDSGWDIPQLLIKEEISSRVLFTYTCPCGHISMMRFSDALQQCQSCKQFTAKPSNVSQGANISSLEDIYQCFDIYVQCSNSEGFGAPVIEAAACGIPVMAVDYSAMSETVRKCGGQPINVLSYTLELETGCYRAKPDIDHMVEIWKHFFSLPEEDRNNIGKATRREYESNYNWDDVVDKLMIEIDKCEYGKWDSPVRRIKVPESTPDINTNKEFLDWAIDSFLPYSDMKNSYEHMVLLKDLNFGTAKAGPCGYFYSENSYFDRVNHQPISREVIIELFKTKADIFNKWEMVRANEDKIEREQWF